VRSPARCARCSTGATVGRPRRPAAADGAPPSAGEHSEPAPATEPLRVVIVEDVPADAELEAAELRRAGLAVEAHRVESEAEFVAALAAVRPGVILSDYTLPAFDAMSALRLALAYAPEVPFIIVTGSRDEETAVGCMRAGAWDYVLKDRLVSLPGAVARALDLAGERAERKRAVAALGRSEALSRLLSDAVPMLISYVDTQGRYVSVNRRYAEWFGGSVEAFQGRHVTEVIGPPAWGAIRPYVERALAGEPQSFEADVPYERLGTRTVRASYTPDRDAAGRVRGFVAMVNDVTALKDAERALRESEERYRLVLANSLDALLLTEPNGVILSANAAACSMFGRSEEEIRRAGRASIIDESDPRLAAALAERARTGSFKGDLTGLRADGTGFPIEVASSVFTDAHGRTLTSISIRDISERRRAELELERRVAELHESEERYRSVFEQSPIGIYRTTPDGRILLANPALLRMLGYDSPAQLAERNLEGGGFDPAYPRNRFKETLERDGLLRGFEAVWTRRDGRQVFVEENATAIRDATGQVVCYEGTVEDVTARKRAEEALRLLATAVEQSAEAVVVTGPDGAIEYVNPAFTRITGWSAQEVLGSRPSLLKSGAHDAAFYERMWETIRGGGVWSGRVTNRRRDGSLYEEEMTISPVRDAAGEIVRFVAVKRDVTAEVALQEQLNQAQKMEAVGRLAGGIAHDFNNLLQAMISQVAVLRHRLADVGSPVGAGLRELDDLVQRGSGLTRQLLLFSRRETSVREPCDLNEVVRSAATLLRRVVRENVSISAELAPMPLEIVADRSQLDQVLMNLAVNASDAMPDGGRLTLRTAAGGATVRLAVTDTGHGMASEVREHLFEPFFTTKGRGKGTGLGLSVVHGIVTAHGGRVEVETRQGGGTEFTVELPRAAGLAEPGRAPEEIAVPPSPAGGSERVLVIEDEDGARDGLAQILTLLGYRVTAVADGAQALALPASPAFDLVLSDLLLPGMSGPEAVAVLVRRWPGLRVVLMSGYTEDEAVRRSVADGKVAFLQKPFDAATLAAAVRRALAPEGDG